MIASTPLTLASVLLAATTLFLHLLPSYTLAEVAPFTRLTNSTNSNANFDPRRQGKFYVLSILSVFCKFDIHY